MEKGQIVTLTIEDMSAEGQGIGKLYETTRNADADRMDTSADNSAQNAGNRGFALTLGNAGLFAFGETRLFTFVKTGFLAFGKTRLFAVFYAGIVAVQSRDLEVFFACQFFE